MAKFYDLIRGKDFKAMDVLVSDPVPRVRLEIAVSCFVIHRDKLVNSLFRASGSVMVLVGEKLVGLIVDNFGLSVASVEKGLNDFVSCNNDLGFRYFKMIE